MRNVSQSVADFTLQVCFIARRNCSYSVSCEVSACFGKVIKYNNCYTV